MFAHTLRPRIRVVVVARHASWNHTVALIFPRSDGHVSGISRGRCGTDLAKGEMLALVRAELAKIMCTEIRKRQACINILISIR